MIEHYILAMHKNEEGKEQFKRYDVDDLKELEGILEGVCFIAQCIGERTIGHMFVRQDVADKLDIKECLKTDYRFISHRKPLVINNRSYIVDIAFEVNNHKQMQELSKDMINFLKQTGGKFGVGQDYENSFRLSHLIANSRAIEDVNWYYIYN